MAKKKRHQPKSRVKKPRRGRGRPARDGMGGSDEGTGGGVMQSMVRGLRQAAGVEEAPGKKKKSSLLGNVLWVVVIAAAAYLAYRNFSQ